MKRKIDFRSLGKTITWRMTATTTTILVALSLTGSIEISLSIGGIEILLKMGLYYIHERLWDRVTLNTSEGE